MVWLLLLLLSVCMTDILVWGGKITNETMAKRELKAYNARAESKYHLAAKTSWDYFTDTTDQNRRIMLDQDILTSVFNQIAAIDFSVFDIRKMSEPVKREIRKILDIGIAAQTDSRKLNVMKHLTYSMESIYSKAKVCLSETNCRHINPDLDDLMSTNRDYDTLLKAWVGWRDQSGKKMRQLYPEFVELSNKALAISGHADTGAYWRSRYEMDNFEEEIERLYDELRPLYEHLHAYVRRKLKNLYRQHKFPDSGHIPAHLLGDMMAGDWKYLRYDLLPFKNKPSFADVTEEMMKQGYTPEKMFHIADDFFASLGLRRMPKTFWKNSVLVKPTDGRTASCRQSAWDFYNKKDFSVLMCTRVNEADLVAAHHEIGHIQYNMEYKDLPFKFRNEANPGFHAAVADAFALSVHTPHHLHKLGLLNSPYLDKEEEINFLFSMALHKVAFLPFGYLVDQWRWSVFRGETKPEDYNDHWWNLRCKYQGVSAPVKRSSSDFDPGALYHIPANIVYIRYFVSIIMQFQFHKAACKAAGRTGDLHHCDIFNSKVAGRRYRNMLKLGSSKPWQDAMEQMTGQRKMSAKPLLEYFEPLLTFLKKENGDDHGWDHACPSVGSFTTAPSIVLFAFFYLLMYLCS